VALFSAERKEKKPVTCIRCKHNTAYKFGTYGKRKVQRYRCHSCKATFADAPAKTLGSHYTDMDRASKALSMMLEGMSIRAISRLTDLDKNTIMSLMVDAGDRCETLMVDKVCNLTVKDVEVDEIWGFVQKKEGHKMDHEKDIREIGDAYCFIGMERSTKLVLAYHLGKRDTVATDAFIGKLRYATSDSRFQLTSDGFKPYIKAVEMLLKGRVDFAQLIKVYGVSRDGEQRYSPAEVVDAVPVEIMGRPVRSRICTSHIERHNLSIRMGMRRMTRLTNGFSKKWENLQAAYSLWFAYYNFCRVHSSLRVTPAMEAKLTDHVWSVAELLGHEAI
jgi:transposase-like protein/IS1 family transposase